LGVHSYLILPHITAAIIDNWKSFHMLKRLCLALAGLFAFVSIASGAGTVPGFSLTPQFDLTGAVAPGCKLYIIQAGTTSTPQNAYQDSALTILQPNPMICDAAGRLDQFFVADGTIKLRLTKSNGTQIFVGDNLLVVGSSSGGGGGGTVDPTTIIATGDFKMVYGSGVLTGFVRCNGRTIGSATSGATERANSDAQSLFEYFWGVDVNLAVSGGRGASANADWVANKALTLPDCRGRALAGLDDMGSSAAGRLTATYFGALSGANGTTLGGVGGVENQTLTTSQIPNLTANGSNSITVNSVAGNIVVGTPTNGWREGAGGNFAAFNNGTAASSTQQSTGANAIVVTTISTGGTAPVHPNVQPTILVTTYIKL
jgi:microcystin-dependent protein